ncbi:MAG: amidohydrolase family protein [Candidatus Tectimicrobiota bacterium]
MDYTIQHGTVIDGTGASRYAADVLIRDGKIAAVAPELPPVGQVINAQGCIVCPGFIDMHTHSQLVVFTDPDLPMKAAQGITTELFGQDGMATFPMVPEATDLWRTQLSGLDCNPPIEWNWQDAEQYRQRLPRPSVNIATLVGHGNLRLCVMGMDDRPATDAELHQMGLLLEQSLAEGAFGMSTGLIYPPCVYADQRELIHLNRIVAKYGGLFVTHMRNEADYIWSALDEVFDVARASDAHLHISHLKISGRNNWGQARRLVQRIDEGRAAGLKITADQYPYEAGSTMLGALLPAWAHAGGAAQLRSRLRDPALLARMKTDMEYGIPGARNMVLEAGYDNIMVSYTGSDRHRDVEGRRLADIARDWHVEPFDVVIRLLTDEDFAVGMITFMIGEEDIQSILQAPWRAMGTDGLLGGRPHPRAYGSCPRILGHYTRDLGLLTLEEAIRKMTGLPAEILRLGDRGVLRAGMAADVVLFNPETINERSSYEDPRQYPEGIAYVFVNGAPVITEGQRTGARPGQLLLHHC